MSKEKEGCRSDTIDIIKITSIPISLISFTAIAYLFSKDLETSILFGLGTMTAVTIYYVITQILSYLDVHGFTSTHLIGLIYIAGSIIYIDQIDDTTMQYLTGIGATVLFVGSVAGLKGIKSKINKDK